MAGIIGRKIGMTRVFDPNGKSVAVTVIKAGPCVVTQVKTQDRDGYNALQLGFEEQKEKNATLPDRKRLEKIGLKPMKVFREFRFEGDEAPFSVGDEVKVDVFQEGERVRLTGWSKGKGFQGVVKRHGFGGGPKTHGQSDRHRAPGSLGQSSYPSRVFKGLRMAGRMGGERVTVKNRRIVRVLAEQNMLMVEGVVPGARNGLVLISN